ncbi:hypothetical protein FRB99_007939 [Tulasnella sp. 403]|nr:hypothetical protein FRB99_007939 [Tulasnella sp. 403]
MHDMSKLGSTLLQMAFVWALFVLFLRRRRNNAVLGTLAILYVLVAAQVVLLSQNTFNAFVNSRVTPGTGIYLEHYHRPLTGAHYLLYFISNGVTETLLLWRVYVVWKDLCPLYMAPPTFLWLTSLASSAYATVIHVHQAIIRKERTDKRNYKILVALAAILLAQNILTTIMIAGRLLYATIPHRAGTMV